MNAPLAHTIHWPEVAAMALLLIAGLFALRIILTDPRERAFRRLRRMQKRSVLEQQRPAPRLRAVPPAESQHRRP